MPVLWDSLSQALINAQEPCDVHRDNVMSDEYGDIQLVMTLEFIENCKGTQDDHALIFCPGLTRHATSIKAKPQGQTKGEN